MKKYIDLYFRGIIHGFGILIIILIGFFVVRADREGISSLQIKNGTSEVLTAAKWNELVGLVGTMKFKLIEDTYSGSTSESPHYIPHGLGDVDKILSVICSTNGTNGDVNKYLMLGHNLNDGRKVSYDSNNITVDEYGGWPITNPILRCIVMYRD